MLWLVWDYMLCTASGTPAQEWEIQKQTLVASCPAHAKLLGWLHSALRKLGALGSPYAIPLTARSLGRCLRLDDIRPGAKSSP